MFYILNGLSICIFIVYFMLVVVLIMLGICFFNELIKEFGNLKIGYYVEKL